MSDQYNFATRSAMPWPQQLRVGPTPHNAQGGARPRLVTFAPSKAEPHDSVTAKVRGDNDRIQTDGLNESRDSGKPAPRKPAAEQVDRKPQSNERCLLETHRCSAEQCVHKRGSIIDSVLLSSRCESLESQLEAHRVILEERDEMLASLENELQGQRIRSADDRSALQSQLSALESQVSRLTADLAEQSGERNLFQLECERLSERNLHCEDRIEELSHILREKDTQVAKLEKHVDQLQRQLSLQRVQPSASREDGAQSLEGLQQLIQKLQSRLDVVESQKSEFLATIKEQQRQIETQREAVGLLEVPSRRFRADGMIADRPQL